MSHDGLEESRDSFRSGDRTVPEIFVEGWASWKADAMREPAYPKPPMNTFEGWKSFCCCCMGDVVVLARRQMMPPVAGISGMVVAIRRRWNSQNENSRD